MTTSNQRSRIDRSGGEGKNRPLIPMNETPGPDDVNPPEATEDVNPPEVAEDVNLPEVAEGANPPEVTEGVNPQQETEGAIPPEVTEGVNPPQATEGGPTPAAFNLLADRLRRFQTDIEAGRIKAAGKQHRAIGKMLEVGAAVATVAQLELFHQLAARFGELRDWQSFVTIPKRQELCSRMQALPVDTSIHPAEKARAIKELQMEWKELGPSDSKDAQHLWSQFKLAADAAYVPCAEFFQEQRLHREQNLAAKETICVALEACDLEGIDGVVDWKAASQLVLQSKQGWRAIEDVPRNRQKKIQNRFSAALVRIEARLKEEQKRNYDAKVALIETLRGLLADEVTTVDQLVRHAKQSQSEWKLIGITDRRADQKLWSMFRSECDQVFSKRDTAKQAVTRGGRGDTADDAATATHASRRAPDSKPGRRSHDAQKSRQNEPKSVSSQDLLAEARRRAAICVQLERGQITAEQADAEWDGAVELPPAILARLAARKQAVPVAEEIPAENHRVAELLCVRIEILAGIDSPPEARQARMQYQVDRLNKALTLGDKDTRSPRQQADDLAIDWYCLGPLPNDATPLIERFETALRAVTR